MENKSMWWKGFLRAEEEIKSGVTSISVEIDRVVFHYPEGGTSGYSYSSRDSGQYIRGMKDYAKQYEDVIKEVL